MIGRGRGLHHLTSVSSLGILPWVLSGYTLYYVGGFRVGSGWGTQSILNWRHNVLCILRLQR